MLASLTMPGRIASTKHAIPQSSGADLIVSRTIPTICLLVSMYTFSAFHARNMSNYCKRSVMLYVLTDTHWHGTCRKWENCRKAANALRSSKGRLSRPLTRPYHRGMPKPNLGDPVAFGGNPTIGPKARNVIAVYFTQLLLPFWQEIFSCQGVLHKFYKTAILAGNFFLLRFLRNFYISLTGRGAE